MVFVILEISNSIYSLNLREYWVIPNQGFPHRLDELGCHKKPDFILDAKKNSGLGLGLVYGVICAAADHLDNLALRVPPPAPRWPDPPRRRDASLTPIAVHALCRPRTPAAASQRYRWTRARRRAWRRSWRRARSFSSLMNSDVIKNPSLSLLRRQKSSPPRCHIKKPSLSWLPRKSRVSTNSSLVAGWSRFLSKSWTAHNFSLCRIEVKKA